MNCRGSRTAGCAHCRPARRSHPRWPRTPATEPVARRPPTNCRTGHLMPSQAMLPSSSRLIDDTVSNDGVRPVQFREMSWYQPRTCGGGTPITAAGPQEGRRVRTQHGDLRAHCWPAPPRDPRRPTAPTSPTLAAAHPAVHHRNTEFVGDRAADGRRGICPRAESCSAPGLHVTRMALSHRGPTRTTGPAWVSHGTLRSRLDLQVKLPPSLPGFAVAPADPRHRCRGTARCGSRTVGASRPRRGRTSGTPGPGRRDRVS